MTYQDVVGTLCACDIKGAGSQYVNDDKCIVMKYPVPYTLKIRGGCAGGGKGALIQEDMSATLACGNDQTLFVLYLTEDGYIYLVRKLTPTECASLQGFRKDWCADIPHSDSHEYKMWGNGMALPCMLYVMEGVAEVLKQRELDRLLGGNTP